MGVCPHEYTVVAITWKVDSTCQSPNVSLAEVSGFENDAVQQMTVGGVLQ